MDVWCSQVHQALLSIDAPKLGLLGLPFLPGQARNCVAPKPQEAPIVVACSASILGVTSLCLLALTVLLSVSSLLASAFKFPDRVRVKDLD